MPSGAAAPVVSVCADAAGFGALREEWNRLHRSCATATPFQAHAWLHSWWLSYGSAGRLRVVLVRQDGRLVAAAPLMKRLRPFPTLTPLGTDISDFSDVLVDADPPGGADAVLDALGAGLWRLARTAVIDFREVRPGSTVEALHDRWRGPRRRLDDSACLELPALPMDDLVQRLPRPRAQRARAKMRKLDATGIERRVVPPAEVGASVRRLLELHQLQWQERKVTTEHVKPRFAEHLSRSATLMAETGDAVVTEFTLDGTVVAADLTFVSPRLAGGYLYGAHPELRERKIDVATMLLRSCAQHLQDGSRAGVLSLLRGTEPYKLHWRPERLVNQRLLLARAASAPQLAALLADVRARSLARAARRAWKERGDERPST
ncbi:MULTISPECIES: GNAT family N-acetyltransferase [unclassified Streptomyces]|uniref:GNAT family N-acetyltransferase n=1 Tax=unclassified Streptomyces TaxID=2593676 RepID=UPI000DBAA0D5|nr:MULTISPECIES: GNAT family N-acetyltransferase [unclassified Streptomyces]MYT73056.1 GNAT family N-acetyltransferase [Streptomyces sp. SID8367]RAJ73853.1 CelD/BcsL family acetyltransferase involved in cellulose biosynthesis [Streptomyces sp. PsTaAH-137]